jgi:hypothetical protein
LGGNRGNPFGGSANGLLDQLGLGQGWNGSRAFVNGPFSEAFVGRPGPGGPEAMDPTFDEAEGQTKKDRGVALIGFGYAAVLAAIL